jgi:enoyl-[acyl-carrier protein] reductase III
MTDREFAGKVALVTGGSRGIGRAIAANLASKGAHVALTFFRSRDAAEEAVKEIETSGVRCVALRANIRDRKSIAKLFERVREEFGRIDILVVNAAMGFFAEVKDFPDEKWDVTIESNLNAYFACVREAVGMMNRGGNIVAITSYGSKRYIPGYAAMGACKAAIEALSRYLAVEFATLGINVNCVSGGPVDTDSLRLIPGSDELIAQSARRTPEGRIGTPEDIARVVSFLCSADAGWIRGQTLVADGGMSLM